MSTVSERPGTKTLDYIALGLLLAPPTVVVEMYLRDESINWRKCFIAAVVCWVSGGLVVFASHWWQSWRTADRRILPFLIAAENKVWVKGLIVAASMGGALALSSFLSVPSNIKLPPVVAHDAATVDEIAKAAQPQITESQNAQRAAENARQSAETELVNTKRALADARNTITALQNAQLTTPQSPLQIPTDVASLGARYLLLKQLIDAAEKTRNEIRDTGPIVREAMKPDSGQIMSPMVRAALEDRQRANKAKWEESLTQLRDINKRAYGDRQIDLESAPDAAIPTLTAPGEDAFIKTDETTKRQQYKYRLFHFQISNVLQQAGALISVMQAEEGGIIAALEKAAEGKRFTQDAPK